MSPVKITVRPNGPYRVEDPDHLVELVDANGNKYDLTGKYNPSAARPQPVKTLPEVRRPNV